MMTHHASQARTTHCVDLAFAYKYLYFHLYDFYLYVRKGENFMIYKRITVVFLNVPQWLRKP